MVSEKETTIKISIPMRLILKEYGCKGEKYTSILERILDFAKKGGLESKKQILRR